MIISPLAPAKFPVLAPVAGVDFRAMHAGFKKHGELDLLLGVFHPDSVIAGVYTKSKCSAAPVDWCRQAQANGGGHIRALVVNAGNANAFTGQKGIASVEETLSSVAAHLSCPKEHIYLASTGVIGEPIDQGKFDQALGHLYQSPEPQDLIASSAQWEQAAQAIRTTDTFAKGVSKQVKLGDDIITISGIAKGSGMIAPDMATMLAFIVTDAAISAPLLQQALSKSVDMSFNNITVDSDTSTSDTVLVCATGQAPNIVAMTGETDPRFAAFNQALDQILLELAHLVVKDGEGAQKFIEVTVSGAENDQSARRVAMSIANSPLVKTAIAGQDANWGRVVMAVGKAGEPANRDKLSISFGGIEVAAEGEQVLDYDETPVANHLKGQHILVSADLGIGAGQATVWTCDLTEGYIRINADYRS